jgi:hypothetical protein
MAGLDRLSAKDAIPVSDHLMGWQRPGVLRRVLCALCKCLSIEWPVLHRLMSGLTCRGTEVIQSIHAYCTGAATFVADRLDLAYQTIHILSFALTDFRKRVP